MRMESRRVLLLLAAMALAASAVGRLDAAGRRTGVTFRKTVIDPVFRSEGVAVADVDRDGHLDIIAGNFWYESDPKGGTWTPHAIRPAETFDPATGYSNSFLNFAADVNGDGWPDQILIGFPGDKAIWAENPRGGPGPWKEHLIWHSACNESPAFADLLGNGQPVLIFPFDERQMAWYEPGPDPTQPFRCPLVGAPGDPGTQRFSHGLRGGDVNGDGRQDV